MQRVNADLREALRAHGIHIDWLAAGRHLRPLMERPEVPSELAFGHWVGRDAEGHEAIGRALFDFIVGRSYDGVFVNVLGGTPEANLMRYLPASFFRVLIVHSISRGPTAMPARLVIMCTWLWGFRPASVRISCGPLVFPLSTQLRFLTRWTVHGLMF